MLLMYRPMKTQTRIIGFLAGEKKPTPPRDEANGGRVTGGNQRMVVLPWGKGSAHVSDRSPRRVW
jgi:hypothetical protein